MSSQSTGPRSDEGKERSSQNATEHGLCSERPVIKGEDPAEWDAFRDCVVRRWLPADPYEQELAERVALQMWRFRRVTRLETQIFNDALAGDKAPRQATDQAEPAEGALPLEAALRRVQRYEAHVSRQLAQAVKLLEKAQAERRAVEAEAWEAAATPGVPEATARRAQLPPRMNGGSSFGTFAGVPAAAAAGAGSFGKVGDRAPEPAGVDRGSVGGKPTESSARTSRHGSP